MTRERWQELKDQCESDMELAIAQGDYDWAKTKKDHRAWLVKLGKEKFGDDPDVVTDVGRIYLNT